MYKIKSQHKSKVNLIFALNKALQKTKIDPKVRFSYIRYIQSGLISALLTEKFDIEMFFP